MAGKIFVSPGCAFIWCGVRNVQFSGLIGRQKQRPSWKRHGGGSATSAQYHGHHYKRQKYELSKSVYGFKKASYISSNAFFIGSFLHKFLISFSFSSLGYVINVMSKIQYYAISRVMRSFGMFNRRPKKKRYVLSLILSLMYHVNPVSYVRRHL